MKELFRILLKILPTCEKKKICELTNKSTLNKRVLQPTSQYCISVGNILCCNYYFVLVLMMTILNTGTKATHHEAAHFAWKARISRMSPKLKEK